MKPQLTITKIKHKQGATLVEWTAPNRVKTEDTFSLESNELPEPELLAALRGLAPDVAKLLDLPPKWPDEHDLQVLGVTFTESDANGLGAVITATAKVPLASAAACLNTPHCCEDNRGDPRATLLPETARRLKLLRAAARRFIDGARLQRTLPGMEEAPRASAKEASANQKSAI